MKKFSAKTLKALSVLLVVVMLAASLASCSNGKVSSFEKVLNPEYVPISNTYTGSVELKDVKGSTLEACNDELAIFKSVNETGIVTYMVYSFRENKIVQKFVSSATAAYSVELFGNAPVFFVTSTTIVANAPVVDAEENVDNDFAEIETEADVKYTLYNYKGNTIDSKSKNVGRPIAFADMVIYNSAVYTIQPDATLVKSETTIPENLVLSSCDTWNDKYLYVFGSDEISIFDRDFNPIYFWEAPATALEVNMFVLNGGNILVQYFKKLATDAEKYDIYDYAKDGTVEKYALTTMVINPDKAKESSLDLDYVVFGVYSANDAKNANEADKFAKKFENLAYVCPIVDGKVDESKTAADLVLMDKNGKITGSVKIADQQTASMPKYISEDLYYVETFYGFALVNTKGEVITPVNNTAMSINDKYIMGQKAIYNFNFEVIYDLDKNDAEVIGATDNAVFVRTGSIKDYKIFVICDDKATQIASTSQATNTGAQVEIIESINCYTIFDSLNNKYSYYNEQGVLIVKAPSLLTGVYTSASLNACLLSAEDGSFYVFAKAASAEAN